LDIRGALPLDVFVNGQFVGDFNAPRGVNGFPETDPSIKMIFGALVNDVGDKEGFLDSTWFNFIYYNRALSNSEVTQAYTAQQAKLFAPAPPTTYTFESVISGTLSYSTLTVYFGIGNTIPPNNMYGWLVTGPGIVSITVLVSANTTIVSDTEFSIPLDSSIVQGTGTYTFTKL